MHEPLRVGILSVELPGSACAVLRLLHPLDCDPRSVVVSWCARIMNDRVVVAPEPLERADVIVIQRSFPQPGSERVLEHVFSSGRPVIYECDDLLTEIPETNSNAPLGRECRPHILETLRNVSCVSVTTPALAAEFEPYARRIVVVPNRIDPRWFGVQPRDPRGPLAIGFVGTPTHQADLEQIEEALVYVAARYPDQLRFAFMGCRTPRLESLPNAHFEGFAPDYKSYAKRLSSLRLDVGLAPLIDDRFNRCKSDIKWLEYSAAGAICVASDVEPYRNSIHSGRDGLLVSGGAEAWGAALCSLIENRDRCRRMATRTQLAMLRENQRRSLSSSLLPCLTRLYATHSDRPRPSCSIVIPTFDRVDLLQQCIGRLFELGLGGAELIVVDNGSSDGTLEYCRSLPTSQLRVIRNETNLGFSRACNQGARASRADCIVFLNNDTIPRRGWLEPLLRRVEEDASIGIVGSRLCYPDGTIQHAGIVFARPYGIPYLAYRGCVPDMPGVNRARELQAVAAASMLVRRSLFEDLGGFDEGYRNGFEDVDLCLRARELGFRVVFEPASELVHLEEQTPGRKQHDRENLDRFFTCSASRATIDETTYFLEDELQVRVGEREGESVRITSTLPNDQVRAAWERVAQVEVALASRDFESVRAILLQLDPWPAEQSSLEWGRRIAEELGLEEARAVFEQRASTFAALPYELDLGSREAELNVTVGVCVYGDAGSESLAASVASVLAQTHADFELLVLELCDLDELPPISEKEISGSSSREAWRDDPRVQVHRCALRGRAQLHRVFNLAVSMLRSDWLTLMPAGDRMVPWKLERQVSVLAASAEIDACFHDAEFVDADGIPREGSFRPQVPLADLVHGRAGPALFDHDFIPAATVMFRRGLVRRVGLQEQGWVNDYQFWLKAGVSGCRVHFLAERLSQHRLVHATAAIRARISGEAERMKREMRRRYSIEDLFPETLRSEDQAAACAAAHFHLGVQFLVGSQSIPDLAKLEFERALDLLPSPEARHNLGLCYVAQGLHGAAVKLLDLERGGQLYTCAPQSSELGRLRAEPPLESGEDPPAADFLCVFENEESAAPLRALIRAYSERFRASDERQLVIVTTEIRFTRRVVEIYASVASELAIAESDLPCVYVQQVPPGNLSSVLRAQLATARAVQALPSVAARELSGWAVEVACPVIEAPSPELLGELGTREARAGAASVECLEPAPRRRILMVVHCFASEMGGTEKYVRDLGLGLLARGFEVTIFCPGNLSGPDEAVLRIEEDAGLRIAAVELQQQPCLASAISNPPVEKLFEQFIAREGFELIHFQHTWVGLPFSLIPIAQATGVPVCLTLHDFWLICARTHLMPPGARIACSGPDTLDKCVRCIQTPSDAGADPVRRGLIASLLEERRRLSLGALHACDVVTAPSDFVARTFERFGVAPGRIQVEGLGIAPIAAAERSSSTEIRFGFLGTFVAHKGADILVRAFAKVRGRARLELHGREEPDSTHELERWLQEDPRLSRCGAYAPTELAAILAGIDALVLPSRIESYCLVAREAFSAGVPVIAFRVGALPELIHDGRNGLLVEPDDEPGLTRAMQRFVDEPSLLAALRAGIEPPRSIALDVTEWAARYSRLIQTRG